MRWGAQQGAWGGKPLRQGLPPPPPSPPGGRPNPAGGGVTSVFGPQPLAIPQCPKTAPSVPPPSLSHLGLRAQQLADVEGGAGVAGEPARKPGRRLAASGATATRCPPHPPLGPAVGRHNSSPPHPPLGRPPAGAGHQLLPASASGLQKPGGSWKTHRAASHVQYGMLPHARASAVAHTICAAASCASHLHGWDAGNGWEPCGGGEGAARAHSILGKPTPWHSFRMRDAAVGGATLARRGGPGPCTRCRGAPASPRLAPGPPKRATARLTAAGCSAEPRWSSHAPAAAPLMGSAYISRWR